MSVFKKAVLAVGSVGSVVAAQASFAAVDLTAVTGAFSAEDIVTGVLAVAATLALVYVSIKGAQTVLSMIRGR